MISGDTSPQPANVVPARSASLRIAVHENLISIGKWMPFHAVPSYLRSELRDIIVHCDNEAYFQTKMQRLDLLPPSPTAPENQPSSVFVREITSFRIAVARYPARISIVVYCLSWIESPDPDCPTPGGLHVVIDETHEEIWLPFVAVVRNKLQKLILLSVYLYESPAMGLGRWVLSPSSAVKNAGVDQLERALSEKKNSAKNWFVSDADEITIPIGKLSFIECDAIARVLDITIWPLRPHNSTSPRSIQGAVKHLHSCGPCGAGGLLVRDYQPATLH